MFAATIPVDQNVDTETNAQAQQKRARIQLSCMSCRHAKLKCDRGHPCSQCVKRNRPSLCTYAKAPVRQRPSKSMQGRLNHLESLVIGLMNNQPLRSGSSPPNVLPFGTSGTSVVWEAQSVNGENSSNYSRDSQPTLGIEQSPSGMENASGQVVLGVNETAYVGATHWAAILDDIEEVRGYFDEEPDEDFDLGNEKQTAAMALGNFTPASRADLLAALPERSIVDRLVSRYFNSNDPAMIIIHRPTFQKEYQEFWADPSTKPVMWIGLLYAMLCLAMFYCLRAGDDLIDSPEQYLSNANKYRTLCAQSLVLANYFKPGRYTMEALLLYFESEFTQPGDSAAKCWVLHAMAVRLALRMGYHRDAKHHSNISAFHGEMRRRVWHLLAQVDLILSFQVGLPSMIRAIQSDTAPPHNLFDDDFSQDLPELPPARPASEATPMSYMICKARICHVFGMIVDQANSISLPTFLEVVELDSLLRIAESQIPKFLQIRPLDQSITDSPNLIMQRLNLILLFHKSRCVLHRKCLTKEVARDQNSYSRKSCVYSGMELLHYQSVINHAVQPGGPLSRDRWFLTTIAAHDFLLGAMVIYLILIGRHEPEPDTNQPHNDLDWDFSRKKKMFQQLELSYEIWKSSPKEARDAKKAARVLKIILRNARRLHPECTESSESPEKPASSGDKIQLPIADMNNAAFLEQSQIGLIPPGQMEDLGTMIDMPDTLDWETWDNHINAPDIQTPEQFWTAEMDFDDIFLADEMVAIEQSYE